MGPWCTPGLRGVGILRTVLEDSSSARHRARRPHHSTTRASSCSKKAGGVPEGCEIEAAGESCASANGAISEGLDPSWVVHRQFGSAIATGLTTAEAAWSADRSGAVTPPPRSVSKARSYSTLSASASSIRTGLQSLRRGSDNKGGFPHSGRASQSRPLAPSPIPIPELPSKVAAFFLLLAGTAAQRFVKLESAPG